MKKNRETVVLLFLLSFMLVYGFYTLLLQPKVKANEDLEKEVETEHADLVTKYSLASGYSANLEKFTEHQETLRTLTTVFYSTGDKQEDFIDLLHGIFNGEELRLLTLAPSDYAYSLGSEFPGSVSPYMAYSEDGTTMPVINQNEGEESPYPQIDKMEISVQYNGNYESVHNFLDKFSQVEKYTICNQLDLSISEVIPEEEEEEEKEAPTPRPGEEEEEEEEKPEDITQLSATITFPRIRSLPILEVELERVNEVDVQMPEDFVDGSYRKIFSFANLKKAIGGLFGGE